MLLHPCSLSKHFEVVWRGSSVSESWGGPKSAQKEDVVVVVRPGSPAGQIRKVVVVVVRTTSAYRYEIMVQALDVKKTVDTALGYAPDLPTNDVRDCFSRGSLFTLKTV